MSKEETGDQQDNSSSFQGDLSQTECFSNSDCLLGKICAQGVCIRDSDGGSSGSNFGKVEPIVPEFCGDNSCNNGESCSSCSADCGECFPSGGKSGEVIPTYYIPTYYIPTGGNKITFAIVKSLDKNILEARVKNGLAAEIFKQEGKKIAILDVRTLGGKVLSASVLEIVEDDKSYSISTSYSELEKRIDREVSFEVSLDRAGILIPENDRNLILKVDIVDELGNNYFSGKALVDVVDSIENPVVYFSKDETNARPILKIGEEVIWKREVKKNEADFGKKVEFKLNLPSAAEIVSAKQFDMGGNESPESEELIRTEKEGMIRDGKSLGSGIKQFDSQYKMNLKLTMLQKICLRNKTRMAYKMSAMFHLL